MAIIAISGTPGTGKTVVAEALSKLLGWKLLKLNEISEKKGMFCGYDNVRKTKIVDVDKLAEEVRKLRGNLVIESHYSQDIPNDLTIVLHCEIKELKKRMTKKGFSEKKIEENLQAEIFEVCSQEARDLGRKILEIDTSGKKPDEIAGEIKRKLKGLGISI